MTNSGRTPEPGAVLGGLLGPTGPQLSCEHCYELLDEYVELELAGADADAAIAGMRAHLDGCGACHQEHDSLLALLTGERPG